MSPVPHTARLLPHPGAPPTSRYARLWTAVLVLAVALAAFAHVAHTHDAQGSGIAKPCLCWSGHDRAAPPPNAPARHLPFVRPAAPTVAVVSREFTGCIARPFQARAPPGLRA